MSLISITYNYPEIFSKKYENSNGYINVSFPGVPNNPNIIVSKQNQENLYSCENLFIYGKSGVFDSKINYDAELIIEHKPITNDFKKLYTCILLKTGYRFFSGQIDEIIQKNNNENISIKLNTELPSVDKCIYYETNNSIFVIYTTPIIIRSELKNLSKNTLFYSFPKNYSIVDIYSHEYVKPLFTEGFGGGSDPEHCTSDGCSIYKVAGPTKEDNSGGDGSGGGDNSNDGNNSNNHANDGAKWSINPHDILNPSDPNEQWMECDNVPIDYDGNVAMYNVPMNFDTAHITSQTFFITLSFLFFVGIFLLSYLYIPLIYSFLVSLSLYNLGTDRIYSRIKSMEYFLSILLMIPIILFLSIGLNVSFKNFNNKGATGSVLTGIYLFIIWIISYFIINYKKINEPFFVGKVGSILIDFSSQDSINTTSIDALRILPKIPFTILESIRDKQQ